MEGRQIHSQLRLGNSGPTAASYAALTMSRLVYSTPTSPDRALPLGPPPAAVPLPNAIAIGGSAWRLILGFALLRIFLAAVLPLTPQEAYYWLWSRNLAWSYFDHPPLASYSIALTTALLGSTSFGIKLAAVGWSLGLNIVWARLILDLGHDRRMLWWSLLALNLVGITAAYGVVIAPDAPLLFAWAATVWAVWRAVASKDGRWWYGAGIFLGLGLLAKYSAVLLVPAVLLFVLASPRQRQWLARPEPYLALVLAALIFTPVIAWNAQHSWASFAFQTFQRAAGMGQWKPRYFAQLVGTQLAVVTPYLFVISLAAWISAVKGWRALLQDDGRLLLIASATVPLVLFTLTSLRSLVKPNWLAPAYWPLVILAVQARLSGGTVPRGLKLGLASSAVLLLAGVIAMAWPDSRLGEANTWSGWPEAAQRVDRLQQELDQRNERPSSSRRTTRTVPCLLSIALAIDAPMPRMSMANTPCNSISGPPKGPWPVRREFSLWTIGAIRQSCRRS